MLIEDVIGRFAKLPCVDQAQRQRTLLARPQTNFYNIGTSMRYRF
jgi:hypothetical protein